MLQVSKSADLSQGSTLPVCHEPWPVPPSHPLPTLAALGSDYKQRNDVERQPSKVQKAVAIEFAASSSCSTTNTQSCPSVFFTCWRFFIRGHNSR